MKIEQFMEGKKPNWSEEVYYKILIGSAWEPINCGCYFESREPVMEFMELHLNSQKYLGSQCLFIRVIAKPSLLLLLNFNTIISLL